MDCPRKRSAAPSPQTSHDLSGPGRRRPAVITIGTVAVGSTPRGSSRCLGVVMLLLSSCLFAGHGADGAAKAEKPVPVEEQLPSLYLLRGPWQAGRSIARASSL